MSKHRKIKVVLSGANGFVGNGVIRFFSQQSVDIHVLHRRPWTKHKEWLTTHQIPNMANNEKAITKATVDADVFIHLAGRAHQRGKQNDYEESIIKLTETLVKAATKARVKRFIYISTILVHGTLTHGKPFNENSEPHPHNWYAASKWKAEQIVKDVATKQGIEYVIIRPPLVYGPGLKGNLKKLLMLVKLGLPLPFKDINNKRSLISLENLSSLIWHCAIDKRAANQIYVAADNHDVSTSDIATFFAKGLKKRIILFGVSDKIIKWILSTIGRKKMADQLLGSLQVDNSKSRFQLGWLPIKPTEIALPESVKKPKDL